MKDKMREHDKATIRAFVASCGERGLLLGRVLDFGSGKQPYRDIVQLFGGDYHPYDKGEFPGSCTEKDWPEPEGEYDAILCNQVIQYLPDPRLTLVLIRAMLKDGGHLVMTGPTNWPIVERQDMYRYTPSGITRELLLAGFEMVNVEERGHVQQGYERWLIGWQAVAQA